MLDLELSILFVLMIALPQWSNRHYLVVLIVPYSVLLARFVSAFQAGKALPKIGIFLFSVSLAMTSYLEIFPRHLLDLLKIYTRTDGFFYTYGYRSIPVYGYLILLAFLTYELLKGKGVKLFSEDSAEGLCDASLR